MDISEIREVGPRDVIIVRGVSLPDDDAFTSFTKEIHAHFPENLIVWFPDDATFDTMDEDLLKGLLESLAEHQQARP